MPCRSITFVLGPIHRGAALIRAECGDLAAAYRDRLCGGRRGIHGDDLAVAQDEIRGLCLKRHGERSENDGKQYAHGIQDTDSCQAASIELPLPLGLWPDHALVLLRHGASP